VKRQPVRTADRTHRRNASREAFQTTSSASELGGLKRARNAIEPHLFHAKLRSAVQQGHVQGRLAFGVFDLCVGAGSDEVFDNFRVAKAAGIVQRRVPVNVLTTRLMGGAAWKRQRKN
jgi:hypothetical protein